MQENISEDNDNDDLYEHYRFTASVGQEPLRVDKFRTLQDKSFSKARCFTSYSEHCRMAITRSKKSRIWTTLGPIVRV